MIQRKAILVLLIVIQIITTGCWNRRELNELAITLAMGIDLNEDGKYLVTAQVVNPGEITTKARGHAPVIIFQAEGDSMLEAFRKMTMEAPRKIYPSHLRILVIGESLAKEGIGKPLDLLLRDWELRSDFYIAVAKGKKAEDILKVPTSLERIPANKLFNTLEVSAKAWSATRYVTLDELIEDMVSEGKQPVLTGVHVKVKGDEKTSFSKQIVEKIDPVARLYFKDLAVFKRDKLIGWLNEAQSKTYSIVTNNELSSVGNVSCPKGGKFVYQVTNSETEVKGRVVNGKPVIDINVRVEGKVAEIECDLDLKGKKSIDNLEKIYEKETKKMLEEAIKHVQKNEKVDIFGFGQAIYRADPKEWEKLKKDWDKKFEDMEVNVNVHGKINSIGTVGNSFLEELK
ncbi:Ger(x)C family spore germination protein [Neobacillus niacini]|uniref:Ger(x)C family spore germination protein n=1 Tax=Neobacillus niacini TaxID=86668 RepID=UPI0039837FC2